MSLLRFLFQITDKAQGYFYTLIMRGAFAAWGVGSRLGRRSRLVGPNMVHVGSGVAIGEYVWLNAKDDLKSGKPTLIIGDGTYIGRFVQINAWRSVIIGENVMIADRVFISDADHNYTDTNTPILLQGDSFIGSVFLGDGCWIGIGTVILPNVTVGKNAVIAANSVVTHDVPDFAVVGGIPAKIIKQL